MPNILVVIVSGLIASSLMLPFFRISKAMGTHVPSLIDVVGTLFTHSDPRARPIATLIHLVVGVAWAFLYFAFVQLFGSPQPAVIFTLCTGVSAFHGLIVSFNLGNMVAEHPTRQEFRVLSPAVAVTYLVAHVVYGATLGILFSALQVVRV